MVFASSTLCPHSNPICAYNPDELYSDTYLLYLYHPFWATRELKDEWKKEGECRIFTASQSSCSMGYYLWRSLHVVRTWAGSLTSVGRDGERALSTVPHAPWTHLSQFLFQFLFIVLTVYKNKSTGRRIPSFSFFLFFSSSFFFQSGWLLNSLCILFLPVCLLEVVN